LAKPLLKPKKIMKISPKDAMAPVHRPEISVRVSLASSDGVRR
jgi:hypothetical protein